MLESWENYAVSNAAYTTEQFVRKPIDKKNFPEARPISLESFLFIYKCDFLSVEEEKAGFKFN